MGARSKARKRALDILYQSDVRGDDLASTLAAEAKRAKHVVGDLFHRYMAEPGELPAEHEAAVMGRNADVAARAIADFIAGMTDRFALEEYARLFDPHTRP